MGYVNSLEGIYCFFFGFFIHPLPFPGHPGRSAVSLIKLASFSITVKKALFSRGKLALSLREGNKIASENRPIPPKDKNIIFQASLVFQISCEDRSLEPQTLPGVRSLGGPNTSWEGIWLEDYGRLGSGFHSLSVFSGRPSCSFSWPISDKKEKVVWRDGQQHTLYLPWTYVWHMLTILTHMFRLMFQHSHINVFQKISWVAINFTTCYPEQLTVSPSSLHFWVDDVPFSNVGYFSSLEGTTSTPMWWFQWLFGGGIS